LELPDLMDEYIKLAILLLENSCGFSTRMDEEEYQLDPEKRGAERFKTAFQNVFREPTGMSG